MRVSKGECFETLAALAPQHDGIVTLRHCHPEERTKCASRRANASRRSLRSLLSMTGGESGLRFCGCDDADG